MDVAKLISLSRRITNTSSWQITDANYLDYVNIIYQDIFARLANKEEKYTRNEFKTDVVINQNEYILPAFSAWTSTGLKKVLVVYLYDTEDAEYKKLGMYDERGLTIYPSEYDNTDKPFYIKQDWSIFIYPTPTENITDWIKIVWTYIPLDLTTSSTETDIKLPREYHNIMLYGINMYVFMEKQLFDKSELNEVKYSNKLAQMLDDNKDDMESGYEQNTSEVISIGDNFLP